MIVWKNVNRFEKQALFQEKTQYQRGCQNTSGKKRGWCCSQDVFHCLEVKRKWRKTWILQTLWSHKKAQHTLRVGNSLLIQYCFYGNVGYKIRVGTSGSGLRASRQWTLLLAWITMLLSQWHVVFLVDTKGYSMEDWLKRINKSCCDKWDWGKNMVQLGCRSTHSENLSSASGFLACGYVPRTGESTILTHQVRVA